MSWYWIFKSSKLNPEENYHFGDKSVILFYFFTIKNSDYKWKQP